MYSCASALTNSAATCGLVESHDRSTMRFMLDARTLTLPAAIPSACSQSDSDVGGAILRAFRQAERRSAGSIGPVHFFAANLSYTGLTSPLLCSILTCVWISYSGEKLVEAVGLTFL